MPNVNGPAYIAMKTKDGDFWLDPYSPHDLTGPPLPISASDDSAGPPSTSKYAPVRTFRAKVERDFGGINSSGGPQTTGRADQSDFFVEQNANAISPTLYQQCCSAIQMSWIHLACVAEDGTTLLRHIVMQDVSLTSYESEGNRKTADTIGLTPAGGELQSSTGLSIQHVGDMVGLRNIDRFTLLYTSISFRHGSSNIVGGWNTGSETPFP